MVSSSQTPMPGLRERKRLATRRAIQHAVVDLATEHGYDHVTIEEVSAAANVSPRTFFNYFASKEEAAVGDVPTLANLNAAQEFLGEGRHENLLAGLGRLLAAASSSLADDRAESQRRRVLLREHPALFAKRMAVLHEFEDELAGLVGRRLEIDGATGPQDPATRQQQARLVALIGFATMRHAYRRWIDEEDDRSLSSRIREAFEELDATLASTYGR